MLEPILQSLGEVEGVQGAMVIDDGAAVIGYRAHAIYDDVSVLYQVVRSVLTAVESVQLVQDDWDVLTAQFGEGKLLLRSLRTAQARRYTLAVIADTNLNVASLGVALRVASQKLVAELEQPTASQSGPIPIAFATGATGRIPMMDSTRTELAKTGHSWSPSSSGTGVSGGSGVSGPIAVASTGSGVSSGWGDVGVMDAASSSFLSAVTKALVASVGPMAKVFVEEAVRKVCGERPFSRSDVPALLAQLASTIDDPDDRAIFLRAARAL